MKVLQEKRKKITIVNNINIKRKKMKNFLMSVFLLALTTSIFSQNKTISYVEFDKNPGVSFTLSMFIPGAGQMYNDEVYLGLGVLGGTIALTAGGTYMAGSNYTDYDEYVGYAMIGLGGALYLAQLIYAPLKSQAINKEKRSKFANSVSVNPSVGQIQNNRFYGASLSLRF